jgi:tetratricopeptide (TPR) repeat protein
MQPSEKPSFARFGGQSNFVSGERVTGGTPQPASRSGSVSEGGVSKAKTAKAFDAIISVVLGALFFGLPVFFTGQSFQGLAFEKQLFFYLCLLVGLVAWVSKGVMTGEMRVRRTPLDLPILGFWLFAIVATVFSVDRWHSFWGFFGDPSRGFISITALILGYYFILSHFTPQRLRLMLGAFLASGTLVILWSFLVVMQIRFLPAAWEQVAPLSLIGSMSTLSLFLALLVPLFITALFLLFRDGDKVSKLRRNILAGVLGLALLLDLFLLLALSAFVPWTVVLGGLGFFLIYILAQVVRPSAELTWVPMVVFVVVLAFLMIGSDTLKLVRATLPIEVTPNAKLSWQIAKEALSADFLSGSGLGTYGYDFSLFRPQEFNGNALYTLRFYQGTGLVFEALATIGAIGTVLMLVVWFSFLSIGLYLLTLDKAKNKIVSLGLWSVAVMLFIAGFIAPINAAILIIGVLIAALALAVLLMESGSEERHWELSFRATPKFALALAFVFMVVSAGVAFLFVFMGKVFLADIAAGQASRETPSLETTVPQYLRAIRLYPQEGRYFTRLSQEYMAIANAEGRKPAEERDVNRIAFTVREAVAAGTRAKDLMPNDVLSTEALGLIYENASIFASDALPKAEEMYMRALELEPQNPLFYIKLGQIKRLDADSKQDGAEKTALYGAAKEYFAQAVEKKPDLAIARYNLAVAEARLKNYDAAIAASQEAIRLAPNDLSFRYNLALLYQQRGQGDDQVNAETLYKNILQANERLVDVRLSLGLLYERQGKRDTALAEYEKILSFIPDSDGAAAAVKQTRTQILQVIENLRSGRGNIPEGNSLPEPGPTTPSTAVPADVSGSQQETLLNGPTQ